MDGDAAHELLGWTPLHRAAFHGDVDAARALVAGGADVDAPAIDGWTPLMTALLEGRAAVARLLVEHGARAEPEASSARLATLACASGDLDTARVVLPDGPKGNDAALFLLAAHARAGNAMRKVHNASESDGDLTGYASSRCERWEVRAPALALDDASLAWLGDAVKRQPRRAHEDGELFVGGIAIGRSESVTTPAPPGLCSDHRRALYVAELAPHLLADRRVTLERQCELLEKAVRAGHTAVVKRMVHRTGKPIDALFAAVHMDDPVMVACLVDKPDAERTAYGARSTALGVAARYSKPRAASALLESGADVERGGDATPLLLAVEKTGPAALDVVAALLEHGANVEARHPKKGWTPLMRAALLGDAKIVERLLRAGANVNAVDKHGMNALRHAHVGRSVHKRDVNAIVELLRGWGAA